MSQENVELVRASIAESNVAEDWVLRAVHPDIEWHLDSNHPEQKVLRGHDEVAEYFSHWRDAFEGIRVDAEDYTDAGDSVVMPFVARGRPRGSAGEVELAETWVFTVRDGLVIEIGEYLSLNEALKAGGLEE